MVAQSALLVKGDIPAVEMGQWNGGLTRRCAHIGDATLFLGGLLCEAGSHGC